MRLVKMGEALFAASPDYAKAMKTLGAQPPAGTFPTVQQACATLSPDREPLGSHL